jgi:hypothetical protein
MMILATKALRREDFFFFSAMSSGGDVDEQGMMNWATKARRRKVLSTVFFSAMSSEGDVDE